MGKRISRLITAGILSVSLGMGAFVFQSEPVQAEEQDNTMEQEKSLNVVFFHDLHSYLDSHKAELDGEETMVGGVSRIKTLINEAKEEDPDTLVLDGGDFSMGTLYQTIYTKEACELRILGALGVDVTTTGNHEFDFRAKGYYDMLEAAIASEDPLPQFVLSNLDWDAMEMTEDQILYKEAFEDYGVKDYTVLEKNGIKIAVMGIYGKDALACAPTCVLKFKDPIEAARETVKDIQENEDVDMIVALSHSGTSTTSESEDEELAKAVGDIDLIISAHSHTVLTEPIVYGDTAIVSSGCYGEKLGSLRLVQKEDGRWSLKDYKLTDITEDIPQDPEIEEILEGFREDVNEIYLSQFGFTSDQVLAYNPYHFSTVDDLYYDHTEQNLGNFIADSYVYAVEQAEGSSGTIDVAMVPSGTIRGTYVKGEVTVEDVFNSFSLGTGADGEPGYPLISVYLTGAELKNMCEVDASVSDMMNSARVFTSGLEFTFNPNRMILNRVTDVKLVRQDGSREEVEDDRLYRVVADLYTGQMLGAVAEQSKGLLAVTPKTADGTVIENMEDAIVYRDGSEVKAWVGIAEYFQSFDTGESGLPEVPASYNEDQGRKVVDDTKNIVEVVKDPNKTTLLIVGAVAAVLAVIVVVIVFVTKRIKRRKNG